MKVIVTLIAAVGLLGLNACQTQCPCPKKEACAVSCPAKDGKPCPKGCTKPCCTAKKAQ